MLKNNAPVLQEKNALVQYKKIMRQFIFLSKAIFSCGNKAASDYLNVATAHNYLVICEAVHVSNDLGCHLSRLCASVLHNGHQILH